MHISLSDHRVTFDKVHDAPDIADAVDVVMDRRFIEQARHDWCWAGWRNLPPETGWYRVDRDDRRLVKITGDQAAELEWHERLYIYGSGHAAVKEHSPLALYIGDEYDDGRLSALYLCGPDVLTWVAQKRTPS